MEPGLAAIPLPIYMKTGTVVAVELVFVEIVRLASKTPAERPLGLA
jgi:hypothetical protein